MKKFSIRFAQEGEEGIVLEFIRSIARFEKLEDQVVATEEGLRQILFVDKRVEVIFAMLDDEPIGFALFFHNFSTFVGRLGLYLEDLYVDDTYRGKGYGKALFLELTRIARERNCGRMEWCALKWNKSAIDFYHSLGAVTMDEWSTFRLSEQGLAMLAEV